MTAPQLIPTRGIYLTDEPVVIEVSDPEGHGIPAVLEVSDLGTLLRTVVAPSSGSADLGPLPRGSYGISLVCNGIQRARSAVQVVAPEDRSAVQRYGFVVDYHPDRDPGALTDIVRRLHLTDVQFYDWAYRHADLLGGGESYADPLGNVVALDTVRELVRACRTVGARALGYAAVYAVGQQEWPRWRSHALLDAEGNPYALGDFLRVVDPGDPAWTTHFGDDLSAAVRAVGFDGFHLDQYGWPKVAVTPQGERVDLAERFVTFIEAVRHRLPHARLVFNNVNDFPTWATARADQDAVYIEVWEPHTTLADLAGVVTRARSVAGSKPVVVAAYQHCYADAPRAAADQATALTMATLFSHGATHLLAGDGGRLLIDPYYARNHLAEPATLDRLARWYDFLVEHHDVLLDPDIVDVTGSYAGLYNDDLDVTYPGAPTSGTARPGAVWRRITRRGDWLVVHLINLSATTDDGWDHPQPPPGDLGTGVLRLRLVGGGAPSVFVADPDGLGHLEPVTMADGGTHATTDLPPLQTWQLILIRGR